jgi:alpha-ketoglutarate-dependent taurine dioxygenase
MLERLERRVLAGGLPLLVECGGSAPAGPRALIDIWREAAADLDGELRNHGAILFRGFGMADREAFALLMNRCGRRPMEYLDGNSPRTKLGDSVYTSTEYPPEFFISLHNELSYSNRWPARLFFCCVTEPAEGGETPLVDSRTLLRSLPGELVEEFRSRGVRYIRNLHGGRGYGPSWQKTFQTSARQDVEDFARSSGATATWLADGSVRLTQLGPGTARHPVTGEEVWFNQADQFHPSTHPQNVYQSMMALFKGREELLPQNATFGDGDSIPLGHLETIRSVTRMKLIAFPWRAGDVLMVDNMLAAHGRRPFKGPRRVLVSMTAD